MCGVATGGCTYMTAGSAGLLLRRNTRSSMIATIASVPATAPTTMPASSAELKPDVWVAEAVMGGDDCIGVEVGVGAGVIVLLGAAATLMVNP
jgi:hypothetical protein